MTPHYSCLLFCFDWRTRVSPFFQYFHTKLGYTHPSPNIILDAEMKSILSASSNCAPLHKTSVVTHLELKGSSSHHYSSVYMCACFWMCERAALTLRSSLKSSAAVVKWGTELLQWGHPGREEHTDGTLLHHKHLASRPKQHHIQVLRRTHSKIQTRITSIHHLRSLTCS